MSKKIAILGPEGTFTETAAKKLFKDYEFAYMDAVEDVFKYVDSGLGEGVVAIENSLEGSVSKTLESLMEYDVKICDEITIDINLCLMKPQECGEITVILSHPHALAQCKKYLKENYPNVKLQASDSTAAAMQELKGMKNAAAIGPKYAATTYNLEMIGENIQDDVSQTRFIVISKKECQGKKTSIIFALKDEAGALYNTLKIFSEKNINLTKIESRPSRKKLGEYIFYVDFKRGKLEDKEVKEVLRDVEEKTTMLKNLGSY